MTDKADLDDSAFVSRRLEATHHPAESVFGVLAFGFAVFLLIQIPAQTSWVKGAAFVAQPAFWPTVAILGMTVFGAAELWFSRRRNRTERRDQIPAEILKWARALEYVLWFMAYVWVVPFVGYLPTTILFCVGLTLRLGYRAPRTLAAAALTGTVTVVVFKTLLGVRIPGAAAYEYLPAVLRNFMILYL